MEAPDWATDKIEFENAIVFYNKEIWQWNGLDGEEDWDEGVWGEGGNDTLEEYLSRPPVKVAKHSQLPVEIVNE